MGSKRSSSKASKVPSIPPPAAPPAALPADNNFQNPRSPNPESPSNSQKKPKLPTPNSTDSTLSPLVLPPTGKKPKPSTPKSTDSTLSPPVIPPKGKKHKPSTPKPDVSGLLSPIPSTPPPAAPPAALPADNNFQNPRSHNPESPSNSQKKPKLSTPNSTDSTLSPLALPPKGKKPKPSTPKSTDSTLSPPVIPPKGKKHKPSTPKPKVSGLLCPIRSALANWGKDCNLKFLESLIAFRSKYGFLPTSSNMADFLAEIRDWAPSTLSEKNVHNKIRHFRFMFQKSPELRPESSEYERTLHQLRLQLWGSESLKAKGSALDTLHEDVAVKRKGKRKRQKEKAAAEKLNGEKQEEEGDDENDEGGDEKAVQTMGIGSVNVHEKDDLLVGEDSSLLDGDVTKFPYKYLKLALEEYWMQEKLNMNTLYLALQKVDLGQAKLLDERYSEVFKGMLKHKMEKNELFNKIISSSLGS